MKYISANWKAINRAIERGYPADLDELYRQRKHIEHLISKKLNERHIAKRNAEKQKKLNELRGLVLGASVYFIGNSKDIGYGSVGRKVKDGRKYMIVLFRDGEKDFRFQVHYDLLQIHEPTPEQKASAKVMGRIFSSIKL